MTETRATKPKKDPAFERIERELDNCLDAWARYRLQRVDGMGYSPMSVEGRMMTERGKRSRRPSKRERILERRNTEPQARVMCTPCDYTGAARAPGVCPKCGKRAQPIPSLEMRCAETPPSGSSDVWYSRTRGVALDVEHGFHKMRNGKWQRALLIRYVSGYADKRAAEAFGTGVTEFYAQLAQARAFMIGHLELGGESGISS